MQKIILTGGGTAGHITPNLALLPYLSGFEVHYVGAKDSLEQKLVTAYKKVTFHTISCAKLVRKFTLKNLLIPFKLIKGYVQSKKLIKQLNPALIFSKGGFVSLPISLAAGKSTPLLLHESDLTMGLANRVCQKKCRYICTAFPELAAKYENGIFTGSPLRQELYYGSSARAQSACGFTSNTKPNLLIMGGSQGATAINSAVFSALNEICTYFNVVHIVGKNNLTDLVRHNYCQIEYCTNIADYFAWANYCISRGGANSIAELIALKIPSLIIPLPKGNSRGDQEDNTNYYLSRGCVNSVSQLNLTGGELVNALLKLINDKKSLLNGMSQLPSVDGTRKISALINAFLS